MTAASMRRTTGENLHREADRINRAGLPERPGMAAKLLERLRRDLREMTTVMLWAGAPWEQRAITLTFHDRSRARVHQGNGTLMVSPDSDPARRVRLTAADGKPLTIRGLMDSLEPPITLARKIVEAHLGGHPHNPLDPGALESAAREADRHALNVMNRLPLEYRGCFHHLDRAPLSTLHTALLRDGSRVAWTREPSHRPESRWERPLAVAALPPDPRWMREELQAQQGDCSNCGGPALEGVNARRIRAHAYGSEIDEVFCLVCTGDEREFQE